MPRRLAHEARSAYDVVDRGLVLLAVVWQGLWVLGDPRLWPSAQKGSVASAAVWLALASLALLLVSRLTGSPVLKWPARWVNVIAFAIAAVAMLAATANETDPDWGGASGMTVLATSSAGLVLGSASAVAWVSGVVAIEAIVVLGLARTPLLSSATSEDVLYPLYALAVGSVMIAARFVLTRDARGADQASTELLRDEQARATAQGVEATLHRQERLLHETVLNTLTAIVRGGITGTDVLRVRLRDRCRESVDVLRKLGRPDDLGGSSSKRLDIDLRPLLVELQSLGVEVTTSCVPLDAMPATAYDAVRAAVREALSNVLRHAQAAHVSVAATSHDGTVEVDVHDDGRGFELDDRATGFGLQRAIIDGMSEVGGSAAVRAALGQGTDVHLEWMAPRAVSETAPQRSPAASAFAIPMLVSFGLFNLIVVVLTRDDVAQLPMAVGAFALYIALSLLMVWSSRRGTVPWWVVIVAVLGGAVVYFLQAASVHDVHGPWTDWASGAIIALFVVAAGAGPRWAWLFVLVGWLLIQGDIVHELLASGTAIIIAAALFGRNIRRNQEIVDTARAAQLLERTALVVAQDGSTRVRRRYESLRGSGAATLLTGIADELLDPDDEGVRRTAALEERFIRTVMRVDPSLDAVHAMAVELADLARQVGVFLEVDLPTIPAPGVINVPAARQSLGWAIEHSLPGGSARLSARCEGDSYVIRLLAPIPDERRSQARTLPEPGIVLDPADMDMLWEIRGARGETDATHRADGVSSVGDRR